MDHILYWNQVALDANKRDFSNVPGTDKPSPEQGGPTLSSRALAIVHLAMYDAHAGARNIVDLPRYLADPISPAGGTHAAAAVAAAAHCCLSALFPRQKAHFDEAHLKAGLAGSGMAEGHAFGLAVAQAMLADRAADPGAGDTGYAAPIHRGAHRPDPANPGQGYHAPFYGARSKLFAVQNQRYQLDAPPAHGSADYTRALRDVRGRGIAPELAGTLPGSFVKRTVDQTLVGLYWAYDGVRELGTPPRLYNLIARDYAVANNGTDVDKNARLFALINVAMGDAGILAWEQKYRYNVWRPVVGIREHDASMGAVAPAPTNNIDDNCDPGWLPLAAPASNSGDRNFTPPFPAYPSGHATFGAAAFHMMRLFHDSSRVGNRGADNFFPGSFVSEELNGVTKDNAGNVRPRHARAFPQGLWQMIVENGFSRIYLGVHWSFDAFAVDAAGNPDLTKNVGGVPLGLKIAEDIFLAAQGKGPVKSAIAARS